MEVVVFQMTVEMDVGQGPKDEGRMLCAFIMSEPEKVWAASKKGQCAQNLRHFGAIRPLTWVVLTLALTLWSACWHPT